MLLVRADASALVSASIFELRAAICRAARREGHYYARDGTIFSKSAKKARYWDFVLLKVWAPVMSAGYAAQIAQQLISPLSAAVGGYWQSAWA